MRAKNYAVKTLADQCRVGRSEQRQQSNLREKVAKKLGVGGAGSLWFTAEYLARTSFSLFQLSPPKTDLCRQEGGTQLRPRMSPTGPVSPDKQWISATAMLLRRRVRDVLCQVEEVAVVL